jgi:putative ABC transport system permease protein
MTTLWQDLVFGIRMLAKKPAFTIVAALSLALAIGANTTIFSLVNATLLGPIPYRDPETIGVIWSYQNQRPDGRSSLTVADFRLLQKQAQSFESMGAINENVRSLSANSAGAGENGQPAERLNTMQFTSSLFEVLGVKPRLGRIFTADEDRDTAPAPVVILADRFWKRYFNSDPNVLGKRLTLDGEPSTVIGVMPEGFYVEDDQTDIILPMGFSNAQINSTARFIDVNVRLKPGVSWSAAQEEVKRLGIQYAAAYPERDKNWNLRIESVRAASTGDLQRPLLLLEGAVLFVLLIACANVANLLLARASSRETEVAVRTALGAERGRLIRQLLTESVLLAVLGGVGGLLVGWIALKMFVAAIPPEWGPISRASIDPKVLILIAAVSILTGLLFGVVPALQSSKSDLMVSLKESGRSGSTGRAKLRFRGALVVAQIGLSLMLLIGAGLVTNSFLHLVRNELGMDPARILTFNFRFPQNQMMKQVGRFRGMGLWEIFPDVEPSYDRVLERVRGLPGVENASMSAIGPLNGGGLIMQFTIAGHPPPVTDAEKQAFTTRYTAIAPNYFATLKIPVLRGRDFNDRDTAISPRVVVVNQAFVRRFFPNEEPVGKLITLDFVPNEQPKEIVGVTGDARVSPFEKIPSPAVFVPHVQQTTQWEGPAWNLRAQMTYILKTTGDPMALVPSVRRAVSDIDPNKPVADVRSLTQTLDQRLLGDRLYMILLGSFGVIAAILAAVGIYGVMAYAVAQRTNEIGIRMALGAGRDDVMKLVFRQSVILIAGGMLLGLAGAFGLTRLLANDLFGVTPTDPFTFSAVSGLLIVVALFATVIPTQRATRVDPTTALRVQ